MARRKAPIIPDELLDRLLAGREPQSALGRNGLVDELKPALAERALNAEMDHHLDGEAAEGRSNSRNGYGRKAVLTETGKLPIAVPRDRLATFEPQLIAQYRRIIYTTNTIEALNAKLRRAVRTRGHFPSDEAASSSSTCASPQTRMGPGRSSRLSAWT